MLTFRHLVKEDVRLGVFAATTKLQEEIQAAGGATTSSLASFTTAEEDRAG